MIGEVNAITGMYIRAMGLHLRNQAIAAICRGLFNDECVESFASLRDVMAGGTSKTDKKNV